MFWPTLLDTSMKIINNHQDAGMLAMRKVTRVPRIRSTESVDVTSVHKVPIDLATTLKKTVSIPKELKWACI